MHAVLKSRCSFGPILIAHQHSSCSCPCATCSWPARSPRRSRSTAASGSGRRGRCGRPAPHRVPASRRPLERGVGQPRRGVPADRPRDGPAVEAVDNGRRVALRPAGQPELRDVGDPQLAGCRGAEVVRTVLAQRQVHRGGGAQSRPRARRTRQRWKPLTPDS